MTMNDPIWTGVGDLDNDLRILESQLASLRFNPTADFVEQPSPRTHRAWRWAALIVVGISAVATWCSLPDPVSWRLIPTTGETRVNGVGATTPARLYAGAAIQTGADGMSQLDVGSIGTVLIDRNTQLRLERGARQREHRLTMTSGRLLAQITAPPRMFVIETPAATAVDLGCAYELEYRDGHGFLHVTAGWVQLVRTGRDVRVPAGARCELTSSGPSVPYDPAAPIDWLNALRTLLDDPRNDDVLATVLRTARPRDTLTVFHLLEVVPDARRVDVVAAVRKHAEIPSDVDVAAILELDRTAMQSWWNDVRATWTRFPTDQP
ncbi:MAG: FecR family protein [Planctomycetota bacterium]